MPPMPPLERDPPREGDGALRHQHSGSSDQGRALIPMWDSSDPDRAPPPLPLNPQSPSLTSRAGTSAAIQSAHAALSEKARESALVPALAKRMADPSSPERPLPRAPTHRRMQSLQPGTVRDLSLMIEGGRDPGPATPRSPEKFDRPSTPHRNRDPFLDSRADDRDDRSSVPSPNLGPTITPVVRPTVRRPHHSILGENTPPQSATMIALQNMSTTPQKEQAEAPLANITNGSTALVRAPQSLDALSNQILSLTSIAASLQKEMSQLSRRSRDNATDLMSLKEATSSRDEDIRKSLRDLVHNLTDTKQRPPTRDPYSGPLHSECKGHTSPLAMSKIGKISLPRIPSPNSFVSSLDRESISTPSLYAPDTPATIALLEKIIREMGTREGQELLLSRLADLSDRVAGMASADKVNELRRYVEGSENYSIAAGGGGGGNGTEKRGSFSSDGGREPRSRDMDFGLDPSDTSVAGADGPLQDAAPTRSPAPAAADGAELLSDDVLKIICSVKDSVGQSGGLTAEVKALVRELRGEVLGMGREIGRRLDEAGARSAGEGEPATKTEVLRVVDEGLAEMKEHIGQLVREHHRQAADSATAQAGNVDYQEVYNAMRAALSDSQANRLPAPELSRDDIIEAVKDAWENYKPEIEIQQLGLERGEILACLEEGLRSHAPVHEQAAGATREDVFAAVAEGFEHFVPPQLETRASLSRAEILDAVRECLEEFEFPVAPGAMGAELSKDDMVDAVRQGLHELELPCARSAPDLELSKGDIAEAVQDGLHSFDFPVCRAGPGAELSRDDVVGAVQEGLRDFDFAQSCSALVPSSVGKNDDEIVSRLHDIMGYLRTELAAISDEARTSAAATSRGTEQVLGATRDGFDSIRRDIESFADRVGGGASQQDIIATLAGSMEAFKEEVAELVFRGTESSREILRGEVESLRDTVNSSLVPAQPQPTDHREVLEVLHEGLHSLRAEIAGRPLAGVGEILDALHEGLGDVRASIDKLHNKPTDLTANDEILDALRSGLETVRSDIDVLREESRNDGALTTVGDGALIPAGHAIKHEDIRNLEALIAQLGVKVETLEVPQQQPRAGPLDGGLSKEDLAGVEETIRSVASATLSKEDLAAVEEAIRNATAAALSKEDLAAVEETIRNVASATLSKEDLAAVEETIRNATAAALSKEDLAAVEGTIRSLAAATSSKEDLAAVEETIRNLASATLSKEDLAAIEESIRSVASAAVSKDDLSAAEERIRSAAPATLSKDDLAGVEETIRNATAAMLSKEDIAALEQLLSGVAAATLAKEDVAGMQEQLRSIQESVGTFTTRDAPASTDPATREDVVAIETILRNTKARLDDLIDGEQAVRKEHVDGLETLIFDTRETLSGLSTHVDSLSRKEDVGAVGSLVSRVVAAFDEMRERHEKALDDPEKVTRTDVKAVETACLDIRTLVDQVVKADIAVLPSKDDLGKLESVVRELGEKLDSQAGANSKALELREAEAAGVGERVAELKAFLEEFQEAVKGKLEGGARGVDAINGLLDTMTATISKNATVGDDLKDMFAAVKEQFEESRGCVVGAKLETDEKLQQTGDLIVSRLDERVGELIAKYDDFQLATEARAAKGEARDLEMEAAVVGQKAVTDELRCLVDTLGSAVTESLEKMEEASKTVFTRVEDLVSKSEENHSDHKAEHQLTRDQVGQAIGAVEGLQGRVAEFQPQILETIREVLLLVGQHYEHSKTSVADIQGKIEEAKPPAPERYDDAAVHEKLDRLVHHAENLPEPPVPERYDDAAVREKLDRLAHQVENLPEPPQPERYDDAAVHEKLDRLVDHTDVAGEAFAQLGTLDKVHQQVLHTAAEISAFIAAQAQRAESERDDREKALQEATVALERRLEEKQHLETTITALRQEAERLRRESLDEAERAKLEGRELAERARQEQQEEAERAKREHQEEEERFRQSLREEEERLKRGLRDEEERFKASLRDEEGRFKSSLRSEEERLKLSIVDLRSEQEALARQKTRLSADLSSLETALRLRREELHDMEARAEGLERRILEGVMDHSRVLLMANASRAKGRESMSRKRVSSQRSTTSHAGAAAAAAAAAATAGPDPAESKPKKAFNMAMSGNRNLAAANANAQGRRILSLSQINNGGAAGGMKRSQSVKAANGARKSSWAPPARGKPYGDLTDDKENVALRESDEEDADAAAAAAAAESDMPDAAVPVLGTDSEVTLTASEPGHEEEEEEGERGAEGEVEEDHDGGSDNETTRRSSSDSTVITDERSYLGTESYAGSEDGGSSDVEGREDGESVLGVEGARGDELVLANGN